METIVYKPLNSVWLKASVVGSIWASIEILLGSFLHNLNIPLSGTILSFISVYLLISFLQIWKEKGLILRAGLVCALMKSISPSAIILGPMIGIMTEALLLELFILLLGRNLVSYMIGGAFAVLSALFHKLLSLLILYGFDFIKIISALYQFLVKQINLPNLDPVPLVIIITVIYIATGIVAAISGYFSGKNYLKNARTISPDDFEIRLHSNNQLFSSTTKQKYSIYYLFLNLVAIIISLILINFDMIVPSVIFPVFYAGVCVYHYKSSLNRFRNLSIWIQFFLITLVAAFLWNGISGNLFSVNGLVAGLKMVARAIIIIIGFSAISIELKNPLVKSVLYKKGFAELYQSLSLAFSALPDIISHLTESKKRLSKPSFKNFNLLKQAGTLLMIFEKEHLSKPQIVIITGELHEGKTTYAKKVIDMLHNQNLKIGGFLSLALNEGGDRTGFDLFDIETKLQVVLCRKTQNDDWFKYGHYYFNPDGFSKGNEILSMTRLSDKQAVVIDEIGPLELGDQGWCEAIEKICRTSSIPQIWIVRKSLIQKVIKKWNVGNIFICRISEDNIVDVQELLIRIINSSGKKYEIN
jgi:nucleoside-triphosphatase THEP1